MAKVVIKRDEKRREDFSEEKIRNSIDAAARDAGLNDERRRFLSDNLSRVIIERVRGREEVRSREIRNEILNELRSLSNDFNRVAEAWERYEQSKS